MKRKITSPFYLRMNAAKKAKYKEFQKWLEQEQLTKESKMGLNGSNFPSDPSTHQLIEKRELKPLPIIEPSVPPVQNVIVVKDQNAVEAAIQKLRETAFGVSH